MRPPIILLLLTCCLVGQAWACGNSSVRGRAQMAVDQVNLKQIGQASLIYAEKNEGRLPSAISVWDYAFILARAELINDPSLWLSRIDPANETVPYADRILDPDKPDQPTPAFRQNKPVFAVALGKITTAAPATTPIAWTRGLQPDGTWAAHSPYGNRGGHILFLSGKVQFFSNLTTDGGQLTRYDGQGRTANILEALPPGTRIGEYEPTTEEKIVWSQQRRITDPISWYRQPLTWVLAAIWMPSILIGGIKKIRGKTITRRLVYWPIFISVTLLLLLSISIC